MRASVLDKWVSFTGKLEGVVPWMYLDILGLVTVAIGNLIDPIDTALSLPFLKPDGKPATRAEIEAEWRLLKATDCKTRNGASNCPWKAEKKACLAHQGHLAAKGIAKLRLTPDGINRVVLGKLAQNNAALVKRFPEFEEWCADAQMFTHSMSWACGPAFKFPLLEEALLAQDFAEALKHCHINDAGPDRIPGTGDDNSGLKPRNAQNKIMLANAIKSQGAHLDPDVLFFPNAIGDPAPARAPIEAGDLSVKTMQKELLRAGFNPGPIDGSFGKDTRAALIAFQKAHGLKPDGIYGPLSRAALEALPV